MVNEILISIQAHLSMLELALHSSAKIKFFAAVEDIDQVSEETENRERIVNIIGQLQSQIENKISCLGPHDLQGDTIAILKSWFNDLSIWSEKMIAFDQETVELLNQQKENSTKEIATIFKNKEMFKGYNQSLKK
jgi:hypothetical protein